MPSINRPLAGRPLHFRLDESHRADHIDQNLVARTGRSARTLIKNGPLRVTLVALGPGGTLATHRAEGPITVHVIAGLIRFRAGEKEWRLGAGELLSLDAGVEHAADSDGGGEFLLTLAIAPET